MSIVFTSCARETEQLVITWVLRWLKS